MKETKHKTVDLMQGTSSIAAVMLCSLVDRVEKLVAKECDTNNELTAQRSQNAKIHSQWVTAQRRVDALEQEATERETYWQTYIDRLSTSHNMLGEEVAPWRLLSIRIKSALGMKTEAEDDTVIAAIETLREMHQRATSELKRKDDRIAQMLIQAKRQGSTIGSLQKGTGEIWSRFREDARKHLGANADAPDSSIARAVVADLERGRDIRQELVELRRKLDSAKGVAVELRDMKEERVSFKRKIAELEQEAARLHGLNIEATAGKESAVALAEKAAKVIGEQRKKIKSLSQSKAVIELEMVKHILDVIDSSCEYTKGVEDVVEVIDRVKSYAEEFASKVAPVTNQETEVEAETPPIEPPPVHVLALGNEDHEGDEFSLYDDYYSDFGLIDMLKDVATGSPSCAVSLGVDNYLTVEDEEGTWAFKVPRGAFEAPHETAQRVLGVIEKIRTERSM